MWIWIGTFTHSTINTIAITQPTVQYIRLHPSKYFGWGSRGDGLHIYRDYVIVGVSHDGCVLLFLPSAARLNQNMYYVLDPANNILHIDRRRKFSKVKNETQVPVDEIFSALKQFFDKVLARVLFICEGKTANIANGRTSFRFWWWTQTTSKRIDVRWAMMPSLARHAHRQAEAARRCRSITHSIGNTFVCLL